MKTKIVVSSIYSSDTVKKLFPCCCSTRNESRNYTITVVTPNNRMTCAIINLGSSPFVADKQALNSMLRNASTQEINKTSFSFCFQNKIPINNEDFQNNMRTSDVTERVHFFMLYTCLLKSNLFWSSREVNFYVARILSHYDTLGKVFYRLGGQFFVQFHLMLQVGGFFCGQIVKPSHIENWVVMIVWITNWNMFQGVIISQD